MAAYVSQFDFDVFVSYAHLDNDPLIPNDPESRWVGTIRRKLQTLLDQKLGKRAAARIWFDEQSLSGHRALTPEIKNTVRGSATLLVIMSEGYLQSKWCRQERETFLEAAGGPERALGRIFVVHRDEVDRESEDWPAVLSDLVGYPFYEKDADTGQVRTLGYPRPDPGEKLYYQRLDRLRVELASKLKEMNQPTAPPKVRVSDDRTRRGQRNGQQPATVYLAEVTTDLLPKWEQIQTHLKQSGLRVVPSKFYSRTPSKYREALDRDLRDAVLFVQSLGPYCFPKTDDLPLGYEGLQLERAKAASKPILRWRPRALNLEAIRDEEHRQFLSEIDVVATELEDLKRMIVDRVRILSLQREPTKVNGDRFVLVNATESDFTVAKMIGDQLQQFDIDSEIVDSDVSLDDITQQNDYDALVVVYGACPQRWVQDRVRECRRVVQNKKHRAPVCAVFIGPPHPKEPLRWQYRRLFVIEHSNTSGFQSFVEAVSAKEQVG